jgi:hypothetical protein
VSDKCTSSDGRKALGAYRAAVNYYLGILVYGSLLATVVVFVPFLAIYIIMFGWPPPQPTNTMLRLVQVIEGLVIGYGGSIIVRRVFARKYKVQMQEMRKAMKWTALLVPALFILILLSISIPKYGLTIAVVVNGTMVFGVATLSIVGFGLRSQAKLANSG